MPRHFGITSPLLLLVLSVAPGVAASPTTDELIAQLGDPRYKVRREAEWQLTAQGLQAFDALLRAARHADPEVAATSGRLLSKITEPWYRRDDSRQVRILLEDFGQQTVNERLTTIEALAFHEGTAALCRIARYDPSPRVSREAARELLRFARQDPSEFRPERFASELDQTAPLADVRPATRWLRIAADPETDTAAWRTALLQEQEVMATQPTASDRRVMAALAWHYLLTTTREENPEQVLEALAQLLEWEEQKPLLVVRCVVAWLADKDDWAGVDTLLDEHADLFTGRRGLYLRASWLDQRGDPEAAEALAQQAFALPEGPPEGVFGERVIEGEKLLELGYPEWALRELAHASSELDPLSASVAYARWKQSDILQDHQRYTEAAQALAELATTITASEERRRHYGQLTQQVSLLRSRQALVGRRWLYEALAHRATGDQPAEIEALQRAIESDPTDADILIAMYRVAQPTEGYLAKVHDRILKLCRQFELVIATQPTDPTAYNQWAWLVANTEGDYAKAVRYSRRSLELRPDNPGFLDTLGRCLYAAGDVQGAIESQRRAVEQMPTMQVMQRQLELFEATAQEEPAP